MAVARPAVDRIRPRDREDPESSSDEQLRLEQDVLSPLASTGKLYAYQTTSPWVQIKSAACVVVPLSWRLHALNISSP